MCAHMYTHACYTDKILKEITNPMCFQGFGVRGIPKYVFPNMLKCTFIRPF